MYSHVARRVAGTGGASRNAVSLRMNSPFRAVQVASRSYVDPPRPTPTNLPPVPPQSPAAPRSVPHVTVQSVPLKAAAATADTTIPAAANRVDPIKGVVIPPDGPSAGSEIPPPPPPADDEPVRRRSGLGRRLVFWLTLTTLIFYPTSALISEHSDQYRDFFTSTFPLAEALVDYADDHDWEQFGPATIMGAISNLTNKGKDAAKDAAPAATNPRSALPGQPDVSRPSASATSPSRNDIKKGVESAKESARQKVDQASSKASELSDRASNKASELSDRASNKASELSDRASNKASELSEKAGDKAAQLRKTAEIKAAELRKAAEEKTAALRNKTEKAADKAGREIQNTAADAKETLSNATAEARESLGNAGKAVKDQAKDVVDGAKRAGAQFSEGVQSLVDEAENALGKTAKDVRQTARESTDDVPASTQAQLVDTQPPRKLDPTHGSDPIADLKEGGKKPYTGPALPLGFEPPPGYYIPKAIAQAVQSPNAATEQPAAPAEKPKPVLPLLAPKVKEFDSSAEEPIISQLASTIDTLASSLSATSSVAGDASTSSPPSPPAVLSQAQTDLSALSNRLKALKEEEKTKLEKSLQAKAAEFDKTLKQRESEWTNKEGQLLEGWNQEREKLVEGWRKVLDRELEGQRVGIEQRLREEVIAQGIELQRRWLRSIKAQVESERGGRLAKLDNLTTSFKQLERITLDNSNHLDANLSLHTLWSALRAVQAKADRGNVSFEDELRVLKSAASSQVFSKDERTRDVIAAMIDSIEASGSASQGIKSFPSLAGWFSTTLLPKIQSVSLVPAEHEAGILSHLASAGLSRVLFRRKAGWVEGDDVGAVLARAEYLLAEKDLDGAAREMNQLQGWAGKLAGDWLREARKRLEVEQALNVISTEATLSSLLLV